MLVLEVTDSVIKENSVSEIIGKQMLNLIRFDVRKRTEVSEVQNTW